MTNSDTTTDGTEQSLSTRVKCRVVGHDWYYQRERGERVCSRCGSVEEYSVNETRADKGAKKGALRYRIEDETLYIERYQVTGHGEDSEYWQWFPVGSGPASEESLKQLKQEIERYVEAETNREEE